MVFHDERGTPGRVAGTPWSAVEFDGNPWCSMGLHGAPWGSMELPINPWNSMAIAVEKSTEIAVVFASDFHGGFYGDTWKSAELQ